MEETDGVASGICPESAELHDAVKRARRRRVLDDRTVEEILGYDEHGAPA